MFVRDVLTRASKESYGRKHVNYEKLTKSGREKKRKIVPTAALLYQYKFKTIKNTILMKKETNFSTFCPHFARAHISTIYFVFAQLDGYF